MSQKTLWILIGASLLIISPVVIVKSIHESKKAPVIKKPVILYSEDTTWQTYITHVGASQWHLYVICRQYLRYPDFYNTIYDTSMDGTFEQIKSQKAPLIVHAKQYVGSLLIAKHIADSISAIEQNKIRDSIQMLDK